MPKDKRTGEQAHFRQGLVLQHSKGQHLLINPRLLYYFSVYLYPVLFIPDIVDGIVEKTGLRPNDICLG